MDHQEHWNYDPQFPKSPLIERSPDNLPWMILVVNHPELTPCLQSDLSGCKSRSKDKLCLEVVQSHFVAKEGLQVLLVEDVLDLNFQFQFWLNLGHNLGKGVVCWGMFWGRDQWCNMIKSWFCLKLPPYTFPDTKSHRSVNLLSLWGHTSYSSHDQNKRLFFSKLLSHHSSFVSCYFHWCLLCVFLCSACLSDRLPNAFVSIFSNFVYSFTRFTLTCTHASPPSFLLLSLWTQVHTLKTASLCIKWLTQPSLRLYWAQGKQRLVCLVEPSELSRRRNG